MVNCLIRDIIKKFTHRVPRCIKTVSTTYGAWRAGWFAVEVPVVAAQYCITQFCAQRVQQLHRETWGPVWELLLFILNSFKRYTSI